MVGLMAVVSVGSHLDDLHLLRLSQLLGRLVPLYVRAIASRLDGAPRADRGTTTLRSTRSARAGTEVTPEEYVRIQRAEIELPRGWSLTGAQHFERLPAA